MKKRLSDSAGEETEAPVKRSRVSSSQTSPPCASMLVEATIDGGATGSESVNKTSGDDLTQRLALEIVAELLIPA